MPFDIKKSVDIIEIMENYISKTRPPQEIRHQIDIGYELEGQSIVLNEIRPAWNNPMQILTRGYAKATFVKEKNIWKIYWKRADDKWHSYKPVPAVGQLDNFLRLVDEDKHGCFKG